MGILVRRAPLTLLLETGFSALPFGDRSPAGAVRYIHVHAYKSPELHTFFCNYDLLRSRRFFVCGRSSYECAGGWLWTMAPQCIRYMTCADGSIEIIDGLKALGKEEEGEVCMPIKSLTLLHS